MQRNHDYTQLIGTLKACERIERQVAELNRQKTVLMRSATAAGFSRVALREVMRMRRKGLCPDDHVPSVYEGLVDEFDLAMSRDGGATDGSNDS